MPKIIFIAPAEYKQADPKNSRSFSVGDIVELPQDQCDRWINRLKAKPYTGPGKKAVESATPKEAKESEVKTPPAAPQPTLVEIPAKYEALAAPKLRELANTITGKDEDISRPDALAIIKAEVERRASEK